MFKGLKSIPPKNTYKVTVNEFEVVVLPLAWEIWTLPTFLLPSLMTMTQYSHKIAVVSSYFL